MAIPIISDFVQATIGRVVDKALAYIPDPQQRAAAEAEIRKEAMTIALAQIEATKSDGRNMGARAFLLYGAGVGVLWNLVGQPFVVTVIVAFDGDFPVEKLPMLDLARLFGLVGGLLGLG
jgi:Holin of 3TMs, for gene-transfer release